MGHELIHREDPGPDELDGQRYVSGRAGVARQYGDPVPPEGVYGHGQVNPRLGGCKAEHRAPPVHAPQGLLEGLVRTRAHHHHVSQPAVIMLAHLLGHVLGGMHRGGCAELVCQLQPEFVNVSGYDAGDAGGPCQREVQKTGEARAQDKHRLAELHAGLPLAAHHACHRLDEHSLLVAHLVRQLEGAPVNVYPGGPHVLREPARVEVGLVQGLANRVVVCKAVVAGVAGHVVGHEHPVAGLELLNPLAGMDHVAGDLVTEHTGGLLEPVPLQAIGAAHARGHDLYKELARADLRDRRLLHANVPVAVVHCYTHVFTTRHKGTRMI